MPVAGGRRRVRGDIGFAGLNQLPYPLVDDIDQLRQVHAEAVSVSLVPLPGTMQWG